MGKIYRTAMGNTIDMDALRTKNEKVRAVGNMNVNARGDIIDSHNEVINDNTKRVNAMYQQTMANAKFIKQTPRKRVVKQQVEEVEVSKQELADIEDDIPNPEK